MSSLSHKTVRFGVSLDSSLLERFDKLINRKGYASRSEAIRDLIRNSLVGEEWRDGIEETVGTITIVYSHHKGDLSHTLADLQHRFYASIISTLHVHLDEHNCLEVLVLRGRGDEIKSIADKLIATKGVKHGRLSLTTTGKKIV